MEDDSPMDTLRIYHNQPFLRSHEMIGDDEIVAAHVGVGEEGNRK